MGRSAPKGPSAAELMAIARANSAAEMDKLKLQQEIERGKADAQIGADKEAAANRMNELKLQGELTTKQYERQLADQQAEQTQKMQSQQEQDKLTAQMEKDKASAQSELNSKELASDLARRKTYLESFWFLDNDNSYDVANESKKDKRADVSILG